MSEINVQVNLEGIGAIDELTQKLQEVQTLIEKINQTPLAIRISVENQSESAAESLAVNSSENPSAS